MPGLLTDAEIERRLRNLRGWRRSGNFIAKTYKFGDFPEGMRFVDKVAEVAEKLEHHPDIKIRYNVVSLSVQTHSVGGITAWDFELAGEIDRLGR